MTTKDFDRKERRGLRRARKEKRTKAFARFAITLGIPMAKKKKTKRFRAVEAVKAIARERIGSPPAKQVIPDRKKESKAKHKLTLGKLLEEL